MEGRRVVRQVPDARRADLDRPGADRHRPRATIAVAVAVFGQHAALVSLATEELVHFAGQSPTVWANIGNHECQSVLRNFFF